MTNKSDFTNEEWNLITNGPEWVLVAMHSADDDQGKLVELRETKIFKDSITQHKTDSELVQSVLDDKSKAGDEVTEADAAEAQRKLKRIDDILQKKATRAEADSYRDFLVHLAERTGEAIGEGFLGFGENTSAAEKEMIEKITNALGASESAKKQRRDAEVIASKAEAERKRQQERAAEQRKEEQQAQAKAREAAAKQREEDAKKREAAESEEAERERKVAESRARAEKNRQEAAAKMEAARKELAEKEAAEEARKATEVAQAQASPYIEEYTVASGDNLSAISRRYYGDPNQWKKIYEANKDVIGENPNMIRPGQVFKIPRLES